jgi:hypothetical protein
MRYVHIYNWNMVFEVAIDPMPKADVVVTSLFSTKDSQLDARPSLVVSSTVNRSLPMAKASSNRSPSSLRVKRPWDGRGKPLPSSNAQVVERRSTGRMGVCATSQL